MITAEAAAKSALPAVPGAAATTGVPEREEPAWPWVSSGPSGIGVGRGCRPGDAGFMPQPCPPPRRKMLPSGRWCCASTSCRLSARRPSAGWRSECRRRGRQGSQGSAPNPLRGWACPGAELGPRAAALSEVGWGLRGDQIFAFARRDPGRVPTSQRPTPCVISVLKRGGRVPLRQLVSSTPWDTGTLPVGLSGGRCGCWAWGRSLRTFTCCRGHRQYLRSGPPYDFSRYRSTVHEVTQAFAAASREVLAVEAELAGPRAQPLLAGHVRSLQQLEETRLATVALLQLMGAPELTGQENPLQMHHLKMKVIKTIEAISEVLQDLKFDAESAE
ncbi:required for excision 1-B domain-containing protein isoform X1 [Diceros bicornis minor]|uniref:required for excision 1-B domain-containing protein isoform X1 n=1 Tax=Diceros bicornis minor TaxID=77932 RepID=UPI0026F00A6C|nr:required for excision 1-B domain-containing protein isoform X1 [Diceros bicornis minor]